MKPTILLVVFVTTLALAGCNANQSIKTDAVPPPNIAPPTPMSMPSEPKNGNYDGRGVVTKIKLETGSVEIDHEDIPGMMTAMKMEFNVRDKKQLNGLAVGDKVNFMLEYKDRNETVVSITKAK